MDRDRNRLVKILESRIEAMVRNIITENDNDSSKRDDETIEKSKTYKKQYRAIQNALKSPKIDATGVMSSALGINLTKDDAARSHAFKKLHKEKTPDESGTYKFSDEEIAAIFNELP